MSELTFDDDIRLYTENMIDGYLKDSKQWYDGFSNRLMQMGIEPDLDRVICVTLGFLIGGCGGISTHKDWDNDEMQKQIEYIVSLLGRRAIELRTAYLNTSYL